VLQVALRAEQAQNARGLEAGKLYRFSALRMVARQMAGMVWMGEWKGAERKYARLREAGEGAVGIKR
jgi:hypothetical protein